MRALFLTFICLFLAIPSQAGTNPTNGVSLLGEPSRQARTRTATGQQSAFIAVLDMVQQQLAVRYRLVEGSLLIHNIGLGPPIIVAIQGSFWLRPTGQDPLFRYFDIDDLRFTGSIFQLEYAGEMDGTYRIGGELALVQEMTLDGRINDFKELRLESGLVMVQARFPWVEIDLFQVPPDPFESFNIHLVAVPWPAIWFSTEYGFHPSGPARFRHSNVSDGDLLSPNGTVVRTNRQLTSRLGIMPVVPDLGLDGVVGRIPELPLGTAPPPLEIWFSAEYNAFSETLGELLGHGDLLSNAGRVVRHNADLINPFCPQPPSPDYGLDAVTLGPERQLLFSTEENFFSEGLGEIIGDGDLLCEDGRIFKRIGELMANFQPIEPRPIRFGLDAVYVWPHGEVWFSTEVGFADGRLGYIGHGDLLSDTGRVVVRNPELLSPFGPIEDLDDFGLDGLHIFWPSLTGDLDFDGDVDLPDFAAFAAHWLRTDGGSCGGADLTGDGNVRLDDLGKFAENWLAGKD